MKDVCISKFFATQNLPFPIYIIPLGSEYPPEQSVLITIYLKVLTASGINTLVLPSVFRCNNAKVPSVSNRTTIKSHQM
jgi:hypothetical protein